MNSKQEARRDVVATPSIRNDVKKLDNEALSDIIAQCEAAIADGTAEIEDYEAFVLCQKELARRTWA